MRKLVLSALVGVAFASVSLQVSAHPQYVAPAHAAGSCGDCHIGGTRSKQFAKGLIELFPIDQSLTISEKIKAIFKLTDAERAPVWKKWDAIINPKPSKPDTAPKLKASAAKYTVKVGKTLVIPFTVTDKEKDTYSVNGTDLEASKPTAFNNAGASKFQFTWKVDDVAYVGTYPLEISVKEDKRKNGRILASNPVKIVVSVVK